VADESQLNRHWFDLDPAVSALNLEQRARFQPGGLP